MSIRIPTDYTEDQLTALHSSFSESAKPSPIDLWKTFVIQMYLSSLDQKIDVLYRQNAEAVPGTIAMLLSFNAGYIVEPTNSLVLNASFYIFNNCKEMTLRQAIQAFMAQNNTSEEI